MKREQKCWETRGDGRRGRRWERRGQRIAYIGDVPKERGRMEKRREQSSWMMKGQVVAAWLGVDIRGACLEHIGQQPWGLMMEVIGIHLDMGDWL